MSRPTAVETPARTALSTRREFLRASGAVFPVAAGALLAREAYGFSREEMPAQLAEQYRNRCAADGVHASTLDAAFARLDAAGVKYNRDEVAASLRCPICGCPILSLPAEPTNSRQAAPSF